MDVIQSFNYLVGEQLNRRTAAENSAVMDIAFGTTVNDADTPEEYL